MFDRRVYATPSVDVISFLAIERRFGVKLAVYDAGFPLHTHKNDANTPLVVDVYLSLARRDYINVTINWEMLSNDACPCALMPRRTRYGRL